MPQSYHLLLALGLLAVIDSSEDIVLLVRSGLAGVSIADLKCMGQHVCFFNMGLRGGAWVKTNLVAGSILASLNVDASVAGGLAVGGDNVFDGAGGGGSIGVRALVTVRYQEGKEVERKEGGDLPPMGLYSTV